MFAKQLDQRLGILDSSSEEHQSKSKRFRKEIANLGENIQDVYDIYSELFRSAYFIKRFGNLVELHKPTHSGKNCDIYVDLRSDGGDEYYLEVRNIHERPFVTSYYQKLENFYIEIRKINSKKRIELGISFQHFGVDELDQYLSKLYDRINPILIDEKTIVGNTFDYNIEHAIGKYDIPKGWNIMNIKIIDDNCLDGTHIESVISQHCFLDKPTLPKYKILDKLGEKSETTGEITKASQFIKGKKNILLLINFDRGLSPLSTVDGFYGTPYITYTTSDDVSLEYMGNGVQHDSLNRQELISAVCVTNAYREDGILVVPNKDKIEIGELGMLFPGCEFVSNELTKIPLSSIMGW